MIARLPIAPTFRDLETLARTIYGEARSEPMAGQIAVGRVIVNRAAIDLGGDGRPDWWGETIEAVCRRPWQFSCWNANDPNRAKLLSVQLPDGVFAGCVAAAALAIGGEGPAWLHGCTHYHARGVSPAWAKGRAPAGVIGRHLFFAGVET